MNLSDSIPQLTRIDLNEIQGSVIKGVFEKKGSVFFYLMASHISSPIFTQFLAWSFKGSGSPDTQ